MKKNKSNELSHRQRHQMTEEVKEGKRPKKRIPLTKRGILGFPSSVNKQEDTHYCWALDDGKHNLQRYFDAAYEFALNREGERESRVSGRSGELLYLLKIPQQYYDEDRAAEQQLCIDNSINTAQLQQSEYVPQGHQAVLSKNMM